MTKELKVVLACLDANGSPDFFFVKVAVGHEPTEDDGAHYDAAIEFAKENGYEGPFVCFDELDARRMPWLLEHFEWETASVVKAQEPKARFYDYSSG